MIVEAVPGIEEFCAREASQVLGGRSALPADDGKHTRKGDYTL